MFVRMAGVVRSVAVNVREPAELLVTLKVNEPWISGLADGKLAKASLENIRTTSLAETIFQ